MHALKMAGVVDNLKNMHWEPKEDLRNTNYVMSCFWCSRHALNKPKIHVLLLKFLKTPAVDDWVHYLQVQDQFIVLFGDWFAISLHLLNIHKV